jgi:hypothetical protein
LTGIIPEDGLARAMDNVELTPLRRRNPKVSRRLANTIEKAMAVRPEDRFLSAEEFKLALFASNIKTQRLEGKIVIEPPPQSGETDENEKLAQELPPSRNLPPPGKPLGGKGRGTGFWVYSSFFLLTILVAVLSILFFWPPTLKVFPTSTSTSTLVP